MRILLFTGKGGVGKTTCAAATALRAAERGLKTLVLSTDPAHSLSDALNRPLGPEPEEVAPNFFAQEVDLYYSMKKYWGNMRELLRIAFRWQGVTEIAAEELAALPGMAEGSALLWLEQFHREGDFDLLVVDSAPTGETLTLLTLPQATQWWLRKAFPFQKTAFKTLGFAVRTTTGLPLDKGYDELEAIFDKLERIQAVLTNPDVCSVRLVMNPEKMVIEEARRAHTYLQLYEYGVDAVLVNRVLPDEAGAGGYWQTYLETQAGYLEQIRTSFEPLPIFQVPHLGREVFGLDLLREIGQGLYGDADPAQVFYGEPTYKVSEEGGGYVLQVRLPLLDEEALDVQRFGDRLVFQVGGQRRSYLLPRFLAYYEVAGTDVRGGWLRVRFEGAEP